MLQYWKIEANIVVLPHSYLCLEFIPVWSHVNLHIFRAVASISYSDVGLADLLLVWTLGSIRVIGLQVEVILRIENGLVGHSTREVNH